MSRTLLRVAAGISAIAFFGVSSARAQVPKPTPARESASLPSLAPLVESVKAAVINVEVRARLAASPAEDELFRRFFGGSRGSRQPREQFRQGAGSGFIIDPNGLALTNNHVVENAVEIRIKLDDGREFDGQVSGRDPLTDVALIKFKGKVENLPSVKLGDSDALRVGDWVVAIGNPFGLASSVSLGIISAKARNIQAGPYDDFLQTDAAINPGNSGGPLFNMRGEVIGINTAIIGGSGIGFAVPSNMAKALLPQLQKGGSVTRGWLGIAIQDLTPELAKALNVPAKEGAVASQVNDGSPAKKAGLKEDDVIVAIDGEKVGSGSALSRAVALKRPGTTANLTVYRGGNKMDVKVQLGTRPDLEHTQERPEPNQSEEGQSRHPKLGLEFGDMDPRYADSVGIPNDGALIRDVAPGSAAERAGLVPGMVIVEASGKPVRNARDLDKAVKSAKSGSVLLLRIQTADGRALRALTIP
jgi:serine protease Do